MGAMSDSISTTPAAEDAGATSSAACPTSPTFPSTSPASRASRIGACSSPTTAQPCVTTSANVTVSSQGPAQVAFIGTQFHDPRAAAPSPRRRVTGLSPTATSSRAEVTVISKYGAFVIPCRTQRHALFEFAPDRDGGGANMLWNGVPMLCSHQRRLPAQLQHGRFHGACRTTGRCAQAPRGEHRQRVNAGHGAPAVQQRYDRYAGYNLVGEHGAKPGVYCVFITMMAVWHRECRATFHVYATTRRMTNRFMFDSFNHPNNWNYSFLSWSAMTRRGADLRHRDIRSTIGKRWWLQIANLAIYEWPDTMMSFRTRSTRSCAGNSSTSATASDLEGHSNCIVHQALEPPAAGTFRVNDLVEGYPLRWTPNRAGATPWRARRHVGIAHSFLAEGGAVFVDEQSQTACRRW